MDLANGGQEGYSTGIGAAEYQNLRLLKPTTRKILANPVRDLLEAIDFTQRPQPVGHCGGFLHSHP